MMMKRGKIDPAMLGLMRKAYIGTYCAHAPYGIALIVDNGLAGFLVAPDCTGMEDRGSMPPPEMAADYSFVRTTLRQGAATIQFVWGCTGADAAIGMVTSDTKTEFRMYLPATWPQFHTIYLPQMEGIHGYGIIPSGEYVPFQLKFSPKPKDVCACGTEEASVTLDLEPGVATCFVMGIGAVLPADFIQPMLVEAEERYIKWRVCAEGGWGDFAGAVARIANVSRIYSSDNETIAHAAFYGGGGCGEEAERTLDCALYFGWHSFFGALLACIEDSYGAQNTVRAALSFQTPEGLVPGVSHRLWSDSYISTDRSQPPIGSMCVWKMHQRRPDIQFLDEVYPHLVQWHDWWPANRDGNKNGLLEWGSVTGEFAAALAESGWDDSLRFEGAAMKGTTMNADAVDLSSLWAADAGYLALIATELGKQKDVKRFRDEQREMNRRINEELWNKEMGMYCSRLWDGAFLTRLTPMNFYPLLCGAPDKTRAAQVLQFLYREDKFWGRWGLPTVSRDDPEWAAHCGMRGHVWPPANYLVWQGLRQYADPARCGEFAGKSVELFMRSWTKSLLCAESYRSDTGDPANRANCTWSGLLPLIGVEALADADVKQKPVACASIGGIKYVTMHHMPIGGIPYAVVVRGAAATFERENLPDFKWKEKLAPR